MRIREERNRPRVVDYVQDIHVQANHYRYGTKYRIGWKIGVDPESSEVYGYQKVGPRQYIPKGTVEHDHFNIIRIHRGDSNVFPFRLEVSDRAEGVSGNYSNSDIMSCSMGRQQHTVLVVPPSVDAYRVTKSRLVTKGVTSSELPIPSVTVLNKHNCQTGILLTAMILQFPSTMVSNVSSVGVVYTF